MIGHNTSKVNGNGGLYPQFDGIQGRTFVGATIGATAFNFFWGNWELRRLHGLMDGAMLRACIFADVDDKGKRDKIMNRCRQIKNEEAN